VDALKLAATLMAPPDPMQGLLVEMIRGANADRSAMAQATINLANNIALMFTKEKMKVKVSE